MSENIKLIRFIDSDYKELFKIPDGESIKITYPPGDDRGTITRQCKFLDEYHIELGGNGSYRNTYHICEFAERMEAIGARYEPEKQLPRAELTPFAAGEDKYFTYNRESGNTCVGHISGNFGNDGERFHSGWYNHKTKNEEDWSETTIEFQSELQSVTYAIRQDLLKDRDSMLAYCQSHPEAKLPGEGNYEVYGFKLKTDTRQYYVRCFAEQRNAHFIAYAYDKPLPILSHKKVKTSVLDKLGKSQEAPKTPRKEKNPNKRKGDAEL